MCVRQIGKEWDMPFLAFRQKWAKVRLMGPVIWSMQWNENGLL